MSTISADVSDDELFNELREATTGLLYPSESDEPFHVFVWKATETDAVRQIAALGKSVEPLTETSLDEFFSELTEKEAGEKFRHLREILISRVTGLRVLRIGEIEVDVWVIGKTRSGNWGGLQTRSIET